MVLLSKSKTHSLQSGIKFLPKQKAVDIHINFCGSRLQCPQCKGNCTQADLAPQRSWRHLDTMQFTTTIHASLPRSKCEACGVLTIAAPWADKHSRFTLLFECMAIEVVQACSNVSAAAALLGLNWKTVHSIMDRAVQRGLKLRELEQINHVAIGDRWLAEPRSLQRDTSPGNIHGNLARTKGFQNLCS